MAQAASAKLYPHPQPLPSRLRACPLPAKMNLTNPGKPGMVGEGSTPCASQLFCVQLNGVRLVGGDWVWRRRDAIVCRVTDQE
jgi:hypothetical protein